MVNVKRISFTLEHNFEVGGKYKIDPDTGVINVQGGVRLIVSNSTLPVQFGKVTGNFYCIDKGLTSLKGSPQTVGGTFYCSKNRLTELTHAPKKVDGNFFCYHNKLTSLVGSPQTVGGAYNCSNNSLTSLTGAPSHIGDIYYPQVFSCLDNPLATLEDAPSVVALFGVTYSPTLPLLRLCNYQHWVLDKSPFAVTAILIKHKGKGRSGALLAAAELIRAGYAENARW